ncbi:metallophosphoesterase [Heyndrickxia shackletonii]|uniref:metallophosphoesterase n=1 Tax=Heyndrickxia shackletonii TaxID=157838 RepID=UPI0006EBE93D|nr:metallophosphoesterase [Heyndrickxia shackletonii]NEY98845.1 hypothetical protein [Heyndrickxia shackletonii]
MNVKFTSKIIIALALILFQTFSLRHFHVNAASIQRPIVHLRILETTDVHGNILNYDYQKGTYVNHFGLARTATLIKKARQDSLNTLLFDNGDLLQGNELMDYAAMKMTLDMDIHPMMKVMNTLGYDAATLGNHDFHYGLPFLNKAIQGANFPYVNANMYLHTDFDTFHLFNPYVILNKEVVDVNGMSHPLKVGVIGFITPYVMKWEKQALTDNICVDDIVASAEKYIPILKKQGADIIIALAHTGISLLADPYQEEQNAILPLSRVKGIDAILFGHTHVTFPDLSKFKGIPGIDNVKGTINGVPAVQAGSWGSYLGVIDLILERKNERWNILSSQSKAVPIFIKKNNHKKAAVYSDPIIKESVQDIHQKTIEYMKK